MESIEVRQATPSDIPTIVSLYNLSKVKTTAALDVKTVEHIYDRLKEHPIYHFYVAVVEDRVVGTFMLLVSDSDADAVMRQGVVENVAVHRKFQRKGVGKQMMLFAIDECKKTGCAKLTFSTSERSPAVHEFYEALGFERQGFEYALDLAR